MSEEMHAVAVGREQVGGDDLYPYMVLPLRREYSQAVDDEQGMRLIGGEYDERELAEVGLGDIPGAYVVYRWVTGWRR